MTVTLCSIPVEWEISMCGQYVVYVVWDWRARNLQVPLHLLDNTSFQHHRPSSGSRQLDPLDFSKRVGGLTMQCLAA